MSTGRATRPSVAVVVNNYNYGRFLREAVESALGQSYERVEVVIVDDGSTDDSRSVIAAFESDVTAVLKPNGGQGSAFNAGLEHSSGDVVLFLDADDVLMPDTCARVAETFASNRFAARVQYRMEVIDETSRRTGTLLPPEHVHMPSGDLRREMLAFPFDVPWMATSGNAFARTALERICPVPEAEFRILADWYIVHLATLLGPIVSLEEVGALRRVHSGNAHELGRATLDLEQLRRSIVAAASARRHLLRLARELGFADETASIEAVCDVAGRLVSLRLAPESHPLPDDRLRSLLVTGIRTSLGRFDVSPPLRLLFVAWLVAEAISPRLLARPLAELFLFPERRTWLNPALAALKRS
ncbi:MAG TPA: glycosyltransferase family 2 protein [Gaiellaceae bacterium]|nr:glycosyltransferase family 2 protein [Gaiellaceae bacterium]